MRFQTSWLAWIMLASLVLCASGCTFSAARRIDAGRAAYFAGDFEAAKDHFEHVAASRSSLAKTAKLDLAVVQLASGDAQAALRQLRTVRDEFDEQVNLSVASNAASMITDDRSRQYKPAGYEEVMIRSMLSLCSLAVGDGDAESYAMQAQMRQSELAKRAEERGISLSQQIYQPLALAPYLRGVLREATHHDYDDALRSYQLVSHIQPQFAPAAADIQRCGEGTHSTPGHGVLYVFACVGRGPILESVDEPTTSAALQIASQLYAFTEQQRLLLPNLASVEVPRVHVPYSPAAALSVDSSGVWLGATQRLVDIGQMATAQNQAEMTHTIARAVARRITKEVAVTQATRAVGVDGIPGELVRFATVTAWSASEKADTRCWSLLSREIQVLRAELPVGKHRIGLTVVGANGQPIGERTMGTVEIRDAANTYVTAMAPDRFIMLSGCSR